jgi:hypothetical protein
MRGDLSGVAVPVDSFVRVSCMISSCQGFLGIPWQFAVDLLH